jgi:hypothetical protein
MPVVRAASRVGDGIIRGRYWVTGAALVTTVLFSFGIFGLNLKVGDTTVKVPALRTSVKLMELFSDDTQIVHDYQWIENRLAQLVPMEVVIATDNSQSILIGGGPQGGSFVVLFRTPEGEDAETAPIPWNATAADVQAALRAAGMQRAVVQEEQVPDRVAYRVVLENGGPTPYLSIETQGELTEDHVQVRHAERLLRRLRMVEQAQRSIVALKEVSTALTTATFAPTLPKTTEGWNPEIAQFDSALNRARPKFIDSGFFAQQPGDDLFRISLRIGAFSDVDYSHFVEDIREAVDPIVYAAVLEAHSADVNSGQPLLDWQVTKQVRDPKTGEATFWYVHLAENEDNPDEPLKFAGSVHLAADGQVTAKIDKDTVYSGPADALPVRPTYTGIVPLVYKAQNELMRSLYTSYAWAFGMIVAVMIPPLWKMAGMWKSIPAAIFIMLPNFYPTAIVFGLMGMLQVPLDVGTMMTASVALGIALDDTVHYLAWFDRGMKEFGMTRRQACRFAYSCCARAMTQTTVVACIGMSVFMLSTFQPTMQFGLYMVPLMAVALFGDLVILPAMLTSPLGWFYVKSQPKQTAAEEPAKGTGRALEPVGSPLGPVGGRRTVEKVRSRT